MTSIQQLAIPGQPGRKRGVAPELPDQTIGRQNPCLQWRARDDFRWRRAIATRGKVVGAIGVSGGSGEPVDFPRSDWIARSPMERVEPVASLALVAERVSAFHRPGAYRIALASSLFTDNRACVVMNQM
jgi:hypothetical protein